MPKFVPPSLKLLQGTQRPDREPEGVPEFELAQELPPAPQSLNVDGKAMWDDLGRQLIGARVMQVVDLYAFQHLCFLWQQQQSLVKAGVKMNASESQALNAMFIEFGLTPKARTKVKTGNGDGKEGNKFAKHRRRPDAAS